MDTKYEASVHLMSISSEGIEAMAAAWPEWKGHVTIQTVTSSFLMVGTRRDAMERGELAAYQDTVKGRLLNVIARELAKRLEPVVEVTESDWLMP